MTPMHGQALKSIEEKLKQRRGEMRTNKRNRPTWFTVRQNNQKNIRGNANIKQKWRNTRKNMTRRNKKRSRKGKRHKIARNGKKMLKKSVRLYNYTQGFTPVSVNELQDQIEKLIMIQKIVKKTGMKKNNTQPLEINE